MIYSDGDRSLKRKWMAKRQLANITSIDVPAKTILYDGFRINVWQQGNLNGGKIFAPAGLVVARSTLDGVDLIVSDFWLGSVTSKVFAETLYKGVTEVTTTLAFKPETIPGAITVKVKPMESQSPFGLINGSEVGPDTVWVTDANPVPGVFAFPGEGYWFSTTSNCFIDLNNNGTADFPKTLVETFLNFYAGDGSSLSRRLSYALETGNGIQPWRTLFGLPYDGLRQIESQPAVFEEVDGEIICCRIFKNNIETGPGLLNYKAVDMWDIPSDLKTILLNTELTTSMWPMGGYGLSLSKDDPAVYVQAVNVTNTVPWTSGSPAEEWFDDNPSQEHWKLFYSFYDGMLTSTVSSDQFITLLDSLADVPILGSPVNWDNARRMLYQFFPWPNNNFTAPYDSAMFTDGVDVYTWTRKYGAVKISRTGITAASLAMPVEVTGTIGVRPEIVKAGLGVYLCTCNNVGNQIDAIYKGSPFGVWTKLADISTGKLLHVRPVKVTGSETFLLGIAEFDSAHYSCFFKNGEWKLLGKLPTAVNGTEEWSMAVFGNSWVVQSMMEFLSPPHVLPQMPVGPYAKYAIGLP